jgi:hypothetical protein
MAREVNMGRDADGEREVRRTVEVDHEGAQPRDQSRWGPIWAGVVTTLATLVVLSVLGAAIGMSVAETDADGALDEAAIGWGIFMALAAFFLGGYAAGKSAAVEGAMGSAFNGALVWAVTLVLTLLLVALGAGAALGLFGTFGMTGEEGVTQLFSSESTSRMWWTFIGMIVGLIVAAAGGFVGAPKEEGREETAGRTYTRPSAQR